MSSAKHDYEKTIPPREHHAPREYDSEDRLRLHTLARLLNEMEQDNTVALAEVKSHAGLGVIWGGLLAIKHIRAALGLKREQTKETHT